LRIGILGSRGIPNRYGGFETLAERLAAGLVSRGEEVMVYCPHDHPWQDDEWEGVRLIRKYDPDRLLGQAGQFIYDLSCILDSRSRAFDIILQLGYTTSALWYPLHPSGSLVVTNIDGMEWKRSKYPSLVKRFLRWSEKACIRRSHAVVADSLHIKDYADAAYGISADFIAYGADIRSTPDLQTPLPWNLQPGRYDLAIARFQPDNNIETIIRASLE